MTVRSDLADAVGNTPLIRLRGPSEATGCEILGKAGALVDHIKNTLADFARNVHIQTALAALTLKLQMSVKAAG